MIVYIMRKQRPAWLYRKVQDSQGYGDVSDEWVGRWVDEKINKMF